MNAASAWEDCIAWMNSHIGFNPRAQKLSDALSERMRRDIEALTPSLEDHITAHAVVWTPNARLHTTTTVEAQRALNSRALREGWVGRVISLARDTDGAFMELNEDGDLGQAQLVFENKSLFTAHGKARKNRYGDIFAFSNHVHGHRDEAIAAVTVMINVAPKYVNPDEFARGMAKTQTNIDRVVRDTSSLYESIPLRSQPGDALDRPEALALLFVDYDGETRALPAPRPPSLPDGHPNSYPSFMRRLSQIYSERFS